MRLLGLPRQEEPEELEPGLVLIQVDGLGKRDLERALGEGRMPFLQRLVEKEDHSLQSLYSGVPASTPAFQAELFYGVPGAVPAFGYRRADSDRVVRLWEREAACAVQEDVDGERVGLLKGGSSTGNLYDGGAEEARFCAASFGLDEAMAKLHPWRLLVAVLLFPEAFLRTLVYGLCESVVALLDSLRAVAGGRPLPVELHFALCRVLLCIVLREFTVTAARVDCARGLPVIAVNLVGYDEQAHQRGPRSRFARWALKGIDSAIGSIARSAWRSSRRDYQVWVYSDHGQMAADAYTERVGRPLLDTVTALAPRAGIEVDTRAGDEVPERTLRSRSRLARWLQGKEPIGRSESGATVVCGMGSLAHVYVPGDPDPDRLARLAELLVQEGGVPLAFLPREAGAVVFHSRGRSRLPEDGAEVFGEDHPFLAEVVPDTLRLLRHRDSGDLVLFGWAPGVDGMSFSRERGTHAAASPMELEGFALLPASALRHREEAPYLRAQDLREEALDLLERRLPDRPPLPRTLHRRPRSLRVVTYNVHGCVGMDGFRSTDRIARVLASLDVDVIALQELDAGRFHRGGEEQARRIAERLRLHYHFHPALDLAEEKFGDAILSRYPFEVRKAAALPQRDGDGDGEPRGAVWVELEVDGQPLQVVSTHLSVKRREALLQAEALTGPDWLGGQERRSGAILLCGDFNLLDVTRIGETAAGVLRDCQVGLSGHRPRPTFPTFGPIARLDHVLASSQVKILQAEVVSNRLTRVASDHLPLVVEVRLGERGGRRGGEASEEPAEGARSGERRGAHG